MARALYFHHHGGRQKLSGELFAVPLFIPFNKMVDPDFAHAVATVRRRTFSDFAMYKKHGGHPGIFAYQVIEKPGTVNINMEFYGAQHVSVTAPLDRMDSREEALMNWATI
ncbi:hypothetical protein L2Y96_03385 [Luteibacter aegosomaticola]|uniref:hypothetical protein n=1 Tax=Luteibacter aegosomaticola TaxID=2911538 RepID=UPI001FFB601F|nr:hypothetical protein [Luteibacter aegosomaticola]UPG90830.1 hypothetical protein L2Y96_03385 [Luteibacter aegosomaticola]